LVQAAVVQAEVAVAVVVGMRTGCLQ